METWIRHNEARALFGIHMTDGASTDFDCQAVVEIVEGKMRELCGEGKQAGGKVLSALVKQVDEPTKKENKWKRVFEIERWN